MIKTAPGLFFILYIGYEFSYLEQLIVMYHTLSLTLTKFKAFVSCINAINLDIFQCNSVSTNSMLHEGWLEDCTFYFLSDTSQRRQLSVLAFKIWLWVIWVKNNSTSKILVVNTGGDKTVYTIWYQYLNYTKNWKIVILIYYQTVND